MFFGRHHFTEVRKRDGRIAAFDQAKITSAIAKAMNVTSEAKSKEDAEKVSEQVVVALEKKYPKDHIPTIEEVQDVVETQLILMDYAKTAKAYILYRADRAEIREKKREIPEHVRALFDESKNILGTSSLSSCTTGRIQNGSPKRAAAKRG